jgi:hypothetical protein
MQDQQKYIIRLEYQLAKKTERCHMLEEQIAYMQALARYGLETLPSKRIEGVPIPPPPQCPQSILKRVDNQNNKNINTNHMFFDE